MLLGVLVNTMAVFLGGGIGLLAGKGIPERVAREVMVVLGLCTLYIGISGALEGTETIVLIVSLSLGTIVGTLLNIDGAIKRLSDWVEKHTGGANGTVAEGFMTSSLLCCVGAMTIVGALESGLNGNHQVYFTKSILDLFSAIMLSGSMGIGVMLSGLSVLVIQGGLTLLAGALQPYLMNAALVSEITCCGSVMLIAMGLNLIGITKLKAANYLPALLLVPLVYWLYGLLPL